MKRTIASTLALLLACSTSLSQAATGRLGGPNDQKAPYVFSADEVQYDEDLGLVVAKGHVEISQDDQILLADVVTYNQRTDTATASGHVSLLQPTGDIMFADYAELQNNMRDGFVRNIRMLMADRSRLAGNTGRRMNGSRTEMRRGVYSPCDLCKDDPTKPPTWQIRGEKVTHDKDLQIVEYRDAIMEIDGFPILYTPYFSHPDPSVKRASGFLAPSFGYDDSLGFRAAIPYYWVLGPDKDTTIEPIFTTTGGIVLNDEYRERFADGFINTQASVAFGSSRIDYNAVGAPVSVSGIRGNFSGTGEFDLDQNWRTTFNIQRASDQTYLLRYHFPQPPNSLNSYATVEDFESNSYLNVSTWGFQSMRPFVGDSFEPFAAPVATYNWIGQPDFFGGQLSFNANALDLFRLNGIVPTTLSNGVNGVPIPPPTPNTGRLPTGERRLSVGAQWEKPFNGVIGDRFELMVSMRGDGYYSSGLPASVAGSTTDSALAGRLFPQMALQWRYPWIRRGKGYSAIIEPVAMVAAAPVGGNPGRIPNEDTQGFEFDDTSLFLPNRFPGYDRVDTGQRVDYGFRGGLYGDNGGNIRFVVGQSYAFQTDNNFLPGSGLESKLSDVVGSVTLMPVNEFDLVYRYRLSKDDLALHAEEVTAHIGPPTLRLGLSYVQIAKVSNVIGLQPTQEISANLQAAITRNWSVELVEMRNFGVGGTNLNTGAGVTYRDECLAITTSIQQSGFQVGDVKPGVGVFLTIVFKNLGEIGLEAAAFSAPN